MTMSLIGENMKKNNYFIVGAGFACLDIIRIQGVNSVMLGGTAANVMTFLSLMGWNAQFMMAEYHGQAGKFMSDAFLRREVECVYYTQTKNQIPKIVEGIEDTKHFFVTICPKCGRNLVKSNLPTLKQLTKIKRDSKSPNVFFFDRLSEGIREYARENKNGWNFYEPNSCRIYSNLIAGIKEANIVKYSEERISEKVTCNILQEIQKSDVMLLIVTMGDSGIKYIYRTETGVLSDWNYISVKPVDKVIDSSGSGDWLTAIFLYLLLKKYPSYTMQLDPKYIDACLRKAQKYASRNCAFVGAQGMLKEQEFIDTINEELDVEMKSISDPAMNWEYDCDYCYHEIK